MKSLLVSLSLLVATSIFSQEVEMQTTNLPVKDGLIYRKEVVTFGYPAKIDGVFINTYNDSCFATEDGMVTSTFNLGGNEYAVLIKPNDEDFVTYSNLKELVVKRGEKIKKGMFIGLLKEEGDQYQLLYMLTNKTGRPHTHDEHLARLQSQSSFKRL